MPDYKQYWNPRSKKWVKIDTSRKGGIQGMSESKFPGIPVKEGSGKNEPGKQSNDSGNDNPDNPEPGGSKSIFQRLFGG